MSRLRAVVVVASGSCDVDVIVTASQLRQLGMEVLFASAEGWSAVTLRDGIVIKPDCSVDRLFYSRSERPFDLLLLPDGDNISFGRIRHHPQLSGAVASLLNDSALKNFTSEAFAPCIIFAGICVRLRHEWGLRNPTSLIARMKDWLLSIASGSHIVVQENGRNADAVFCGPSSNENPVETAELCHVIAQTLVRKDRNNVEKMKMGNLKYSAIETWRKHSRSASVSRELKLLTFLRNCRWIPIGIRTFFLSPICSLLSKSNSGSYRAGRLLAGLKLDDNPEMEEPDFDRSALAVASKSTSCVAEHIKNFVSNSLDLNRRPLPMCQAAVLVCNRVDEVLLSVLVHSLRSQFKIMTHVIACDRRLLQSRDPFVITRGMQRIRADNFIETARPCYDVILAVDTEVVAKGPGIWYRKSNFDWEDFELICNRKTPPHVSCVAAQFNDGKGNCADILQSVVCRRRNPFTNEWVNVEVISDKGKQSPSRDILPEAEFFRVCKNVARFKDGIWKGDDTHDLLFQTFRPFHTGSVLHACISSRSNVHDAIDFSRAVTDCLRRLVSKQNNDVNALPQYSRCTIM